MFTKILQFLMRRHIQKVWGKRCADYEESCGNCVIWKAYEYVFYPYKGTDKAQAKFEAHLKSLTYTKADYDEN